jgi:hypothetical protein
MRTDSVEYEREAFCLSDSDNPLQRFETFIQDQDGRTPVTREDAQSFEITGNLTESVTENLTLRISDEVRVTAALVESSKKRKTGSVFSVEVDLSSGEMVSNPLACTLMGLCPVCLLLVISCCC